MHRVLRLLGNLNRERAAGIHKLHESAERFDIVGDIQFYKLEFRLVFPREIEHIVGAVCADNISLRKPIFEHGGAVAYSAAEINYAFDSLSRQSIGEFRCGRVLCALNFAY